MQVTSLIALSLGLKLQQIWSKFPLLKKLRISPPKATATTRLSLTLNIPFMAQPQGPHLRSHNSNNLAAFGEAFKDRRGFKWLLSPTS